MWSLCGMRECRQWWWWGRAPGCKVRNSAPGTVLSENLALIGPSSCYHQLPTQICWQVLSVQKQNPCQWWTQVQARRRALWHNPLQSCTESLDKTQAHRFCPSWVRVAANQWDSTLGKEQIVMPEHNIVKIIWIMFLLACRIFWPYCSFAETSCFYVSFFSLWLARLHNSREWNIANDKHAGKWSHQTLAVHAGWLIDSVITCLQNKPTGPGDRTLGGPSCIPLHLIELEINGLSELGRSFSSVALFITPSVTEVPKAHWCLIWNLLLGLETAPLTRPPGLGIIWSIFLPSGVCEERKWLLSKSPTLWAYLKVPVQMHWWWASSSWDNMFVDSRQEVFFVRPRLLEQANGCCARTFVYSDWLLKGQGYMFPQLNNGCATLASYYAVS